MSARLPGQRAHNPGGRPSTLGVLTPLEPLSDAELSRLSDEDLVARVAAAREAGDRSAALQAIGILAFGYLGQVRARVEMKVPPDQVDDVVNEIMISAMKSSFDGKSVGEFSSWLHTITRRRIADAAERTARTREKERKLPSENAEDDDSLPDALGVGGGQEEAELLTVVRQALEQITDPAHKRVIELYGSVDMGFSGLPARDTAKMVNAELGENPHAMSETNVHKIYQRFCASIREQIEESVG